MSVSIRLLGGFAVEVDDAPLASAAWRRRHAAGVTRARARGKIAWRRGSPRIGARVGLQGEDHDFSGRDLLTLRTTQSRECTEREQADLTKRREGSRVSDEGD